MIVALIVFAHIVVILWMLWRLDRSYKQGGEADFGLLALKDDPFRSSKREGDRRA